MTPGPAAAADTAPGPAMPEPAGVPRFYVGRFLQTLGYGSHELTDSQVLELFRLLSREEERATPVRHNNHNWEVSLAPISRREQAYRPYIEGLVRAWEEQGRLTRSADAWRPRWPGGKRFALCLTHDIDILQEYVWLERLRHLPRIADAPLQAKAVLFADTIRQLARRAAAIRRRPSPPLDAWLEVEDRHGFRSTHHFFADRLPRPTWEDKYYRYDDTVEFDGGRTTIGDVIGRVADQGWDVGLHGSRHAHADEEVLRAELRSVEQAAGRPVVSTRQHHLTYDVRVTPRLQERVGLQIDSSLGSNIDIGYRCGLGLPFFMFDSAQEKPLDVLQIPLVVQDNPLAATSADNGDLMVERCLELIDRTAEVGGAITLLWHNQHRPGSLCFTVYERVLRAAAARGAWGCSMRQLNDWWRRTAAENAPSSGEAP